MFRRTVLAAGAVLALAAGAPTMALAKDAWPVKTITLVQPYAPGGTSDMLARIIANELEKRITASVIVESKAGANGNIATAYVSRAKPDGGTFLVGSSSPVVISPTLYKNVPYDPVKDLTPITPLAKAPFLLVTGANSGINSVDELLKLIKADKINFGSAGAGSPQHMIVEMFHMQAKAKTMHVPYKGSAPLVLAVMSNEVQYAIDNPVPLKPQIEAGKIKALAITSKTASPKFPGVKPLAEQGFPGFEAEPWYGMIGSKGLPQDLAERMNKYVREILAQENVKQKISDLGAEAYGLSTADFAKLIAADIQKWGAAVKASGATAD
ncbi:MULTISPECIES: Bug family tripartite tricarboxylate transporter substrate binding protein [Diaphorobacter]|jgi:tripartite-type tricarboxylate transporter receptor subunit TctC|uniref:Bug family tripartite tricarboxylate transporter substrate binding protein n=1 Tax=Diaphorobacter TaxID=238749 RepID=UPI000CDA2D80|nr:MULTISPECIES: tripartite tricarboxylate transporter substrate binding protein [Diaphorobacter]MDU7586727.1 tripartite tricarboxylate transporter substrate binding protein [Acidovorax sp.]TFI47026.1 tripartite tricarboxylate transporter substrate binding protein [Diaphorobacter sp. DS2]POR10065.1 LacI family transcriptional regulator [Diaphorobacter sp. LR2014-1]PZU38295.1 MAG: tripartite tricarboxylate transporter substrate binding protein [Acidovorax sp.]QJY33017.1 tripartite tricarboxylat